MKAGFAPLRCRSAELAASVTIVALTNGASKREFPWAINRPMNSLGSDIQFHGDREMV